MLQNNRRPTAGLILFALGLTMVCAVIAYPYLFYAKAEPPGENTLFIPGADIRTGMTVASYTQESVDKHDVVYSLDNGENHPFILGHDYGTLRKLHKTEVGDYIYISIDEKVEAYRVVVSEYARSSENERDIVGQETGAGLWEAYGEKTLHMYTCHGWREDGRWLVLAELDPTVKSFPQTTNQ